MDVRLRRLAETDLVRNDYPIAILCKGSDRFRPVGAKEILAVEKHDNPTIIPAIWRDVHIGHPQVLSFDGDLQKINAIWVIIPLQ